jgi:hypothetical protein
VSRPEGSDSTLGGPRRTAWPALLVAAAGLAAILGPPLANVWRAPTGADRATVATHLEGRWRLPPGEAAGPSDELAALREVLRLAGAEDPAVPDPADGVSLDRIAATLQEAGIEASWYEAPARTLATLRTPFLAVVEIGATPRLVLVRSRRQGWFYLVEPEHGRTLAPYRWLAQRAVGPVLPLAEALP